ncbi:MAG TPA: PEGA domain-containing protein [Blastocatellia bacterium]|nr:PEGA domain-containing protein [Blastocatellia bacterium]
MSNYTHRDYLLFAALAILLLVAPASAQDKTLVDEDWYGDVKKALADHYTGKTVRVKMPIPATRRGLEMIDGSAQREAAGIVPPMSARIGDELMIKSFRVGDSNVEVLLGKDEPPPKRKFPNPFAVRKDSRINLRFSHELSSKDLTIENLNRYLGQAIDVTALASPVAQINSTPGAALNQQGESQPAENPELNGAEPALKTVADLPAVGTDVGELTIECSEAGARIYIDGAYSGLAPRTLRLRAGFHSILVVNDMYKTWEQRLLVPGAKISVVRAELKK